MTPTSPAPNRGAKPPAAKTPARPGRPPVAGATPRQREVLDFVRTALADTGLTPTVEEIRRHFRFKSTFAVRCHLLALAKKGLVEMAPGIHRGLRIVGEAGKVEDARAAATFSVPLLGDAPAGVPVEAVEVGDERLEVDGSLFKPERLFAIRVRGDSMLGAGINDRDLALIRPAAAAPEGAIVLARLNGETTLKRLGVKQGRPYLLPENPAYRDIVPESGDDFTIVGVLTGIIRKY